MTSFSAFGENLLVNGSFEANSVAGDNIAFLSADHVPGWRSLNGEKLEIWDSGASGVASSDGSNHLELDRDGTRTIKVGIWPLQKTKTVPSPLDGIYQDVQTEVGQTYLLTFDVRARGSNFNSDDEAVVVEWNGVKTKVDGYRAAAAGEWTTVTVEVEGTGGLDRLLLRESVSPGANDATGPFLDNIQLHAANQAPEAVNDSAGTVAETPITINVLGNDTDADGDALIVTSLNGQAIEPGQTIATANGSVTLEADEQLTFTPNAGFTGTETFSYQAEDPAGAEDTAQVAVLVTPPVDPQTGFIGNRVFFDANQNGVLDSDEAGVDGVRVTLLGAGADGTFGTSDDSIRSQTTGNGGYYGFGGLASDRYQVGFSQLPDGLSFTSANVGLNDSIDSDADPSTGITGVIDLAPAQFLSNVDAGLINPAPVDSKTGFIGNRVFLDANQNGIQDGGEGGVDGIQVTLIGAGADGTFETGDDLIRTQITSNGGYYGFKNLAGDRYQVGFSQLPNGLSFTSANESLNDNVDSDVDPATGITEVINLSPTQVLSNVDAGVVGTVTGDSKTGFIGNRVFFDANGNGLADANEAGFGGVQVTLSGGGQDGIFGTADDISRSQTVGANGYYGFSSLEAGDYIVSFSGLPEAFGFTAANVGSNKALDSDANPRSGRTGLISLAAGEFNSTIDAGVVQQQNGGKIKIVGTEQANWPLLGTNEADNILGLGGNDRIEALGGDDHLTGGSGNDHLYGDAGDDSLNGSDDIALGKGEVDNLTGGAGRDRFILGNNDQSYYVGSQWGDFAIINDFTVGDDLAVLSGSAAQYALETNFVQDQSTLYNLGNDGQARDAIAVFQGNTNLSLNSSSFEFINAETAQFGFQSGSVPPLATPLTQGQTPASVTLTKEGATVDFSNSIIISVGFDPTSNDPAFSAELLGETQLLFGEAEDAIVNNPLLGSLGSRDGRYDVSRSEIVSSSSTGATPLGDVITVNIGDGNPDLAFEPIVQGQPPLILQAGGSFSQADPLLGSAGIESSYEIFLEIEDAPNGTLRNQDPIVVESDFGDSIYSGDQLNLKYSSGAIVPLYAAGPDGTFWTGDEWVAAKLVPGGDGNSLTVNLSSQLV